MDERDFLAYFNQPEFKELLNKYEAMLSSGHRYFFEADELTDIAEYYATNHQEERANSAIEYALTLHPDSVDPLVFKSRTEMLNGRLDRAKQIADSINDQTDREVIFLHAEIMLCDITVDPENVSSYLEDQLQIEKDDFEDCYTLALDVVDLFMDYNVYTIALRWGKQMLNYASKARLSDTISARNKVAICLRECNQIKEAITLFNEILDEDPYYAKAWYNLGIAYYEQEEYNDAIDAMNYALAIEVDFMDAVFWKGKSYASLGNHDEANRCYERCLEAGCSDFFM